MDRCALHLFSLHSFSVDDVFLPVNVDDFASLLTFEVSSHNLSLILLSDGHRLHIVLSSQLFRREDLTFLQMWEGALKCLSRLSLKSEVIKGMNFIFATGVSAVAPKAKTASLIVSI